MINSLELLLQIINMQFENFGIFYTLKTLSKKETMKAITQSMKRVSFQKKN